MTQDSSRCGSISVKHGIDSRAVALRHGGRVTCLVEPFSGGCLIQDFSIRCTRLIVRYGRGCRHTGRTFIQPMHCLQWRIVPAVQEVCSYRGADKSLARPGMKQANVSVTIE